jgi:hypothetical protein
MKTGFCTLFALASLSCLSNVSATQLLYDNLEGSSDYGVNFGTGSAQIGNDITLAGPSTATEFDLQYYFSAPSGTTGNETAEVRFYENDGPQVSGAASPGTMIYDSGVFNMATYAPPTTRAILAFDLTPTGGNAMNLSTPVSDLTWTVQFNNITGSESAGVTLYDPATVGQNYPTFWENTGSGWTLNQVTGDPSNFGAQLYGTAVPEPSTVSILGGLGLLALTVLRCVDFKHRDRVCC